MSAESELRDWILGDDAIKAEIGTRIYPKLIPMAADVPAIAYQRISSLPQKRRNGRANEKIRYQITAVSTTYLKVRALIDALKQRIESYSADDAKIISMEWTNDNDEGQGFTTDYHPARLDVIVFYCNQR